MQAFKENDELEQRVTDAVSPVLSLISNERTQFYNGAYEAFPLGGVLYDLGRDPLAGVITREVFITSFFAIHELFTRPGTFEFYLEVCRAVWGDSVQVTFAVPDPGHLQINIDALEVQLSDFMVREIVNNEYIQHQLIDDEGDVILFQGTQGIKTQSETNALFFELYPAGIWLEATLNIV